MDWRQHTVKALTNDVRAALRNVPGSAAVSSMAWLLIVFGLAQALAQDVDDDTGTPRPSLPIQDAPARRTAAIHWRQVPLRDAVARLNRLFDETVFVDRRVDPNLRVNLDIDASSAEEVLIPIGVAQGLGVNRLGRLTYLGPPAAAEQLRAAAAARVADVSRLPASERSAFRRRRRLTWPRLTDPRGLITSLVEQQGWRIEHPERIPHDLWAAGSLPEIALSEQIAVLLIGFDLTFVVRARERAIAIVPLQEAPGIAKPQAEGRANVARSQSVRSSRETRQVYTLRVNEQPVGAVLRELTRRLNWPIDIDEEPIRAAGRSLDARVSFAVENVEQDELLEALLQPVGLDFRREGERILIIPRDDSPTAAKR